MTYRIPFLLLPVCVLLTGCADSSSTGDTASAGAASSPAPSEAAPIRIAAADLGRSTDTFSSGAGEEQGTFEAGQQQTGSQSAAAVDLLAPGSAAPEVQLASVVHGDPFNGFTPGKVQVVEFWATWCGPCLKGMPHIAQLQEQYGAQVQFVGVTHEDEETVTEFLKGEYEDGNTWFEMLNYSIALDNNGATNEAYMQAARQTGIPCAFIVRDGTVAWIGHPASIDEPLARIVGGRWDVAAARQNFIQQASASREVSEQQQEAPEITLGPGVKAPELTLAAVVDGPPVAPFEAGRVYVVEFWATWCGPCLRSMPHISDLQEEYGNRVQFIGITDEDDETITEFMQQESPDGDTWADALKYSIALDDENATNDDYLVAAGQDGIPVAFIVDQNGRVAWIGHPATIDQPLADVVSGRYNLKAAAASFQVEQALAKEDFDRAMKLLNALIKHQPDNLEHRVMRLQLFSHLGDIDSYNKSARQILRHHADEPIVLNTIAWFIATEQPEDKRDLDLALDAVMSANETTGGNNWNVLDTIARVYRERGDLEAAVKFQERAVEAAPDSPDLKASLEFYKKELAGDE